jgi:hypothetical protein
MRNQLIITLLALTLATSVDAQTPAPPVASPAAAHYTTEDTDIGTLLDDPQAKAILVKYIPELVKSEQIDMARSLTLRAVQQYAADMVTDAKLAAIDSELAKLPAKTS